MAKSYNVKDLDKRANQLAPEEGGRGQAGLYRHPESGQEAIVQTDPLFGNAQANAFERLGFEWVREVEADEIKTIADAGSVDSSETKADLERRNARALDAVLDQNELLASELKKQRDERSEQPKDATDISGERARASAAEQASVRSQADGTVAVTQSGDMVKTDGLTPKQEAKIVNDVEEPKPSKKAASADEGAGEKSDENSDEDSDWESDDLDEDTDEDTQPDGPFTQDSEFDSAEPANSGDSALTPPNTDTKANKLNSKKEGK